MTRAKRKLIGRIDPETGETVPTDGRNRKKPAGSKVQKETDYKKMYERLLGKYQAQEVLIESLKKQLADKKGRQ